MIRECHKCGTVTSDLEQLEQHLIAANHMADADYPVYIARVRVENCVENAERALQALDDARANLARIETQL